MSLLDKSRAMRRPTNGVLPPISERQFQSQIEQVAKLNGWATYHTWNSIHSPAGFPDLVLVRPPRLLFVEVKAEKGKLTPQQQVWIDQLRLCGQTAFVWKPADWTSIVETLAR